jgi:hypothetical protein
MKSCTQDEICLWQVVVLQGRFTKRPTKAPSERELAPKMTEGECENPIIKNFILRSKVLSFILTPSVYATHIHLPQG